MAQESLDLRETDEFMLEKEGEGTAKDAHYLSV